MSPADDALTFPSDAPASVPARRSLLRWLELIGLLVLPPALYTVGVVRPPIILALVVMASLALWVLWRDPTFDRKQLWRAQGLRHEFRHVGLLFVAGAVLFIGLLAVFDPDRLFSLPRERPRLWLLILVAYPLLSVYPQEVLWRRN